MPFYKASKYNAVDSKLVGGYVPPAGRPSLEIVRSLSDSGPAGYRPSNYNQVNTTLKGGYTAPTGRPSLEMLVILNDVGATPTILPNGIEPGGFGTAKIATEYLVIKPIGVQSPDIPQPIVATNKILTYGIPPRNAFGSATIEHKNKVVSVQYYGIWPKDVGNPTVTSEIQTVDLAGRGIFREWVSYEARVSFTVQQILPPFIFALSFGRASVFERQIVYPVGSDMSFVSENHELVINTRRIYPDSGFGDPARYGQAYIRNNRQDINLHNNGIDSFYFTPPIVFNKKQEVFVGAYNDGHAPDFWPIYYPFVDNKRREMQVAGWRSTRFGSGTNVFNKAIALYPPGTQSLVFGSGTFIAHKNHRVLGAGYDASYIPPSHIVYNNGVVVKPTPIATPAQSTAHVVINRNRIVKHNLPYEGGLVGDHTIGFGIRRVYPSVFNDVAWPLPEVRHNPYPIAPVGIPIKGEVGAHYLYIYKREIRPPSFNVRPVPAIGEPFVENRNRVVGPYGYTYTEVGVTTIVTKIRYVAPTSFVATAFEVPIISYRTKYLVPSAISAISLPFGHQVRNLLPDPPSKQTVQVPSVALTFDLFGNAVIDLRTIRPSWYTKELFGAPRVFSTAIEPKGIFLDGLFGVPMLSATQYITASGIEPGRVTLIAARLTPFHIYAPAGSERPDGYQPGDAGQVVDALSGSSFDGSRWPWFGNTTISLQNRRIGPVPTHGLGWLDGITLWGVPKFELMTRYIRPSGMRLIRFGGVVFLGVPQYVTLDAEFDHRGIAPANAYGYPKVEHYSTDKTQRVTTQGSAMSGIGLHTISSYHRTIVVSGIPHSGNPQIGGPNPWGNAMVGYPRKYEVGMGVQTLFGTLVIDFRNRVVAPTGWRNDTFRIDDYNNYLHPMKVRLASLVVAPKGVYYQAFGTQYLAPRTRYVGVLEIAAPELAKPLISMRVSPGGFDSSVVGQPDKWEPNKIKAAGYDMSVVPSARIGRRVLPSGINGELVNIPRFWSLVTTQSLQSSSLGKPNVIIFGGCTDKVVAPLPILGGGSIGSVKVTS